MARGKNIIKIGNVLMKIEVGFDWEHHALACCGNETKMNEQERHAPHEGVQLEIDIGLG